MQSIIILLSAVISVQFVVIVAIAKFCKVREILHQKEIATQKYNLEQKYIDDICKQCHEVERKLDLLKHHAKASIAVPGTEYDLFVIPLFPQNDLIDHRLYPIVKTEKNEVFYQKNRYTMDMPIGKMKSEEALFNIASIQFAELLKQKKLFTFKIGESPDGPVVRCLIHIFEKK